MGIDLRKYRSHPPKEKYLHRHLRNVAAGACKETDGKLHLLIELASLFHDLGKINPHFQIKLDNPKYKEYTQHAYLSAAAWLCFFQENKDLLKNDWKLTEAEIFGIAALVAHHHGNLPNLGKITSRIFNNSGANPTNQLKTFLESVTDQTIPISDYLDVAKLLPNNVKHNKFNLVDFDEDLRDKLLDENLYERETTETLSLFQNLQFSFASLIESDKRDASDNTTFKNKDLSKGFREKFSANLANKLQKISTASAEQKDEKKKRLDALRSKMREEALTNLRRTLTEEKDRRVFSLPAPTGAGKTLMLLSLADEIIKYREDLSVIYALPFLAITEQTERICLSILENDSEKVLRVDSKSENKEIEKLQKVLDANPSDDNVKKLLQQLFSNETFDHPFIITTFVQVFETLVSNRNATLLRLPNFSKTIFLLDEIQALPPSLYTFFVAYLDEFCRRFDSYAIVSTATMPHLKLPADESNYDVRQKPSKVFKRYEPPEPLLNDEFYSFDEFNRYRIQPRFDEIKTIDDLAREMRNQEKSCLMVLNTIKDTKNLYKELNGITERQIEESDYILLNTHFTLEDRQRKLALCQERLCKGEKVVLISTQLIEAGVDIDFPVVYRDLCPLPSLIQTAGRCNRNNRLEEIGEVYFFELTEDGKNSSAKKIYGRNFDWFLSFTKDEINKETFEKDILPIQQKFAKEKVSDPLIFGEFKRGEKSYNLVECINQMRFEDFAKVKLIDAEYGVQLRYYVPKYNKFGKDENLDKLKELLEKQKQIPKRDFDQIRVYRNKIEGVLKKMSSRIVTIRVSEFHPNLDFLGKEEVCGIRVLSSVKDFYSPIDGLRLDAEGANII